MTDEAFRKCLNIQEPLKMTQTPIVKLFSEQ